MKALQMPGESNQHLLILRLPLDVHLFCRERGRWLLCRSRDTRMYHHVNANGIIENPAIRSGDPIIVAEYYSSAACMKGTKWESGERARIVLIDRRHLSWHVAFGKLATKIGLYLAAASNLAAVVKASFVDGLNNVKYYAR